MEFFGSVRHFLDPLSLLLVFGGAALVAALRSTRSDMAAAFAALTPLFRADPAADALAARVAVGRITALAEVRGLSCTDRAATTAPFLRRAAFRLAEAQSTQAFALWAEEELLALRARHDRVAAVWRAVADAAPAMGMVGTVIGLMRMFGAMDDMATLGPAMAQAMLTTLYGLILGNLIAGPIAARLERLSHEEAAWRAWTLKRLEMLAAAEFDGARPPQASSLRVVA
jgi:chemotaxis protein MotA